MNTTTTYLLISVVILFCSDIAIAEQQPLDPIEKRKLRNAQLERVSPTMDRVENMSLSSSEIMSKNISEVSRSLKQVEEVLDTLSLIGDRHDQATALLNIDDDSRAILTTLLSKEGERIAAIKKQATLADQARLNNKPSEAPDRGKTKRSASKGSDAQVRIRSPKNQKIQPVLAKVFERSDRPAKAILRVGSEFSKTVYVGQTFMANQIEYTLSSVKVVGEHERVPGRQIYEIILRDQAGLNKRLIWD